jgi:hypothetical protein
VSLFDADFGVEMLTEPNEIETDHVEGQGAKIRVHDYSVVEECCQETIEGGDSVSRPNAPRINKGGRRRRNVNRGVIDAVHVSSAVNTLNEHLA